MRRVILLVGAVAVVASAVVVAAGSSRAGKAHASSSALPSGEIVFTRWVVKRGFRDTSSLYVMASDGSRVRQFLRNASNAAVSKDGRRIAFNRAGAIWVMQRDGSGQRQLTHPPKSRWGPFKDDDPAWSPDGRVVYFSRQLQHDAAFLFSVRADGGGLQRLSRSRFDCHEDPAPSPDGRLVVYVSVGNCSHGFDTEITAMTDVGQPAQLPVTVPAGGSIQYVGSPAWSPEGGSLAYVLSFLGFETDPPFTALYITRSDGSTPQHIVLWRGNHTDWISDWISGIAWSSDGNWLVLTREERAGTWLVRRDGTGLRRITHANAGDSDPAWLPPAR